MTHHISGFIGPTEHLEKETKQLANAKVIPLAQGLAFLPLGDELYEEIWGDVLKLVDPEDRQPMMWLADLLKGVPIAWIETDYFGGAGDQSAILWKDGIKKRFRKHERHPIDSAMAELGVICEGDNDEFDTLGLGKHRTNDSWLGKARW